MGYPILAWLKERSLATQFILAGGPVMLIAIVLVGGVVTTLITSNVTRNAAATTALYVDSVIAPLLPDMQKNTILSDGVGRALDETLDRGALGARLAGFKIWSRDGTILYSKDHSEIGMKMLSKDLQNAWSGEIVAQFNDFSDQEQAREGATGLPLLEIYNPILQPWSGEVVAVLEFYEIAHQLQADLRQAQLKTWAAVAAVIFGVFLSLYAIVFRGSQTIDRQATALASRVQELTALLSANESLRRRVQDAARRGAALNERLLRKIGADLHDGPAQLVALAALRLDADDPGNPERANAIAPIRESLEEALDEIRTICNGLVLPKIEKAQIDEIVVMAARAHEDRTRTSVELNQAGSCSEKFGVSAKICSYRFVQEALNNAYRHAGGAGQQVRVRCSRSRLLLEVSDAGPGFDLVSMSDGLGLPGLRDRVESLGGHFRVETSPAGTRLSMVLNREHFRR